MYSKIFCSLIRVGIATVYIVKFLLTDTLIQVARDVGLTDEHLPNLRTAMNSSVAHMVQQNADQNAGGGQGPPPPAQPAQQDDQRAQDERKRKNDFTKVAQSYHLGTTT